MYFQHSPPIWRDFPQLVPGGLYLDGITGDAPTDPAAAGGKTSPAVDRFAAIAKSRLAAAGAESELPEIQAWRRAFAQLGLKPTQYRCASESLLRRFRKEGSLPRLHPLVDLCNAVSLAFAIPVAVFDVSAVTSPLEVRYATGAEIYVTFAGEIEHPAPGEVIFADRAGQAHARRWTNRQSGRSAVRDTTATALIVAEALHDQARDDISQLIKTLAAELHAAWSVTPQTAILTASAPRFTVEPGGSGQRRDRSLPAPGDPPVDPVLEHDPPARRGLRPAGRRGLLA
jgi:DNA/RNA-binding domain of Phe-tRNA-synthetase-like protein